MLGAIEAMHGKGFLHRDIKPSNFAFDDKQSIHILDFGLSRKVKKLRLTDRGAEGQRGREAEAETATDRKQQR